MDNNYENMTPETDFIPEEVAYGASDTMATDEAALAEAETLLETFEEATESNPEDLPIPQLDGAIDSKKAKEKKAKKKKEPKPKKEKVPKEPKVKKEKTKSISEDKAKSILSKRKKFHILNFSRKLAILCIVPLVLLCIIISTLSTNILRDNLEKEIEGSLKIVAVSLEETYSNLYIGDYYEGQSGALYKGENKISGKTGLLDSLQENTGFHSSFYYDKRVIISTIKRTLNGELAGGRISGMEHMSDEIYQSVVVEGQEVFCTDYVLQDVEYYAYFKPLINSDGSIVGCIFAGKTSAEVNAQIAAETNKITLFSAIISVVCVILIFVISMGMSKTMVRTKNFLQVVSTGDLRQSASPRFLKRDDELGDMYAISYTLQEELKDIVTNIKLSADDLSVSSEQLMTLSQDTVSSVSGLYDSVEFISKGAADQADQTSIAAIQVSNIGDQIDNISEDVVSLSDSANRMAEAEQASTTIINELNVSN